MAQCAENFNKLVKLRHEYKTTKTVTLQNKIVREFYFTILVLDIELIPLNSIRK